MIDRKTLQARVSRRVKVEASGCWTWLGAVTRGGYGTYRTGGFATTAHRVAYIAWRGPIPKGFELDHLCRNTKCVNPAHLEAVTHLENVRRGSKATQSACAAGHPFDARNTYRKRTNGCRVCKACAAARQRRRRAAVTAGQITPHAADVSRRIA